MGDPKQKPDPQHPESPNRQLLGWQRAVQPLALLIAVMLLLGAFLRVYAIDYPSSFLFDEHHFVENARNYLHNRADWNDHPPLGKLIIAQSIAALGDNSLAWRLPALVFGALTILFGALAGWRLFRSARAGWLAAAFMAVDGFLIAYSRGALLDGYLACVLAMTLFLVTLPLNFWVALAAGGLCGAAISIKFSGIAVLMPCLLMYLFARLPLPRRIGLAAVTAVGMLAVYFLQYSHGLSLAQQASGPLDVIHDTERLIEHHAGLTDMKNPWVSGWITWFIPVRPVMLAHSQHLGSWRILTSLGNLALWWASSAALVLVLGVVLMQGIKAVLNPQPTEGQGVLAEATSFVLGHGHSVLLLLAGVLGFIAPWVLSHRDSYIYHYLPSYMALLVLLAGLVDWLGRRRPRELLLYTSLVLVVAAYYAPLWSTLEIAPAAARARLFLGGWR